MRRSTCDQRGSALIALLILGLMLAGFAASFLSRGIRETQAGAGYRAMARARTAAEGLLARARHHLRTSQIDSDDRNLLLSAALSSGAVRTLADGSTAVNEINGGDYRRLLQTDEGSVWVTRLEGDYFRLEAEATVGLETVQLSETHLERTTVAAFQRYVPGVGVIPGDYVLTSGQEPVRSGDLLRVNLAPLYITFLGGNVRRLSIAALPALEGVDSDPRDPPSAYDLPSPPDGAFEKLLARAGSGYVFGSGAEQYVVTLSGAEVTVTEYNPFDSDPPTTTLPVPDEGVLYIAGGIRSLSGDLNGRMTIVSTGVVQIRGSLRYVDDEGHTRMLGGADSTTTYSENPDYDGDSVLGVVARECIYYSTALPTNAEINAALYSHTGTIGLRMLWFDDDKGLNESGFGVPLYYDDYTARSKASLKELGSKFSAGLPVSAVNGTTLGFSSRISLYDSQLRERPPPGFPTVPVRLPTIARRVAGVESLDGASPRTVTRRTSDQLLPVADAERFAAMQAAVRELYPAFGVETE